MNLVEQLTAYVNDPARSASRHDTRVLSGAIQPVDARKDFTTGDNNYVWYVALGAVLKPKSVGEIGVRFGYSLRSIAIGCQEGGVEPSVVGWDNNSYEPGSIDVAAGLLSGVGLSAELIDADTQKIDALAMKDFDLFHVDGDHSRAGTLHDLELAWAAIRPGGWLIVDDVTAISDVRIATSLFCEKYSLRPDVMPSLRGIAVVQKPIPPAPPIPPPAPVATKKTPEKSEAPRKRETAT